MCGGRAFEAAHTRLDTKAVIGYCNLLESKEVPTRRTLGDCRLAVRDCLLVHQGVLFHSLPSYGWIIPYSQPGDAGGSV